MKDDRERLLDMLDSIQRIEKYAVRGKREFESNELVQTWIVHHIRIIGEAAGKVTKRFRERHAELPWRQMIAMRNVLVHDYSTIDVEEVWATVKNDLPPLATRLQQILKEEESSG